MAATFFNLESGQAFRVLSTEDARDLAVVYAAEVEGKSARQLEAYKRMPDSVLFRVQKVNITLNEYDLPGPTRRKVACGICGQVIRDGREVDKGGQLLCQPCAEGAYFCEPKEIAWPAMNWTPAKSDTAVRRADETLDTDCC